MFFRANPAFNPYYYGYSQYPAYPQPYPYPYAPNDGTQPPAAAPQPGWGEYLSNGFWGYVGNFPFTTSGSEQTSEAEQGASAASSAESSCTILRILFLKKNPIEYLIWWYFFLFFICSRCRSESGQRRQTGRRTKERRRTIGQQRITIRRSTSQTSTLSVLVLRSTSVLRTSAVPANRLRPGQVRRCQQWCSFQFFVQQKPTSTRIPTTSTGNGKTTR